MKFRLFPIVASVGALIGLAACDGSESTGFETPSGTRSERSTSAPGTRERVRDRADAAFAELGRVGGQTRFETRVGSQPWPADLPPSWPTPGDARVVADSKRRGGERLPERALHGLHRAEVRGDERLHHRHR